MAAAFVVVDGTSAGAGTLECAEDLDCDDGSFCNGAEQCRMGACVPGTALACAAGVALAVLAWAGVAHWSAVVVPMIVYMFASSYVLPHATAAALSPFPAIAGSASSLLGAFQFCVGAAVSVGLGAAFEGSARPMTTLTALAGAGAYAACRLAVRGHGIDRGLR